MCRDCGCDQANQKAQENHSHLFYSGQTYLLHRHAPRRAKTSPALPIHQERRKVLEHAILAKNDGIAAQNRTWFEQQRMRVLNLISSPGSGKTALLEKTVRHLALESPEFKMAILAGDQEREFDTLRLRAVGAEVLQLNTGSACHLDASMIRKELGKFVRPEHRLLIIENVGNLVCPAAFDLGENEKVALLSTTEGEDKPSKYPLLFREASLIVLTKMDLMPYLNWSLELCEQHIRKVNATAPILCLSSKTGEGLGVWCDFLKLGKAVPQS